MTLQSGRTPITPVAKAVALFAAIAAVAGAAAWSRHSRIAAARWDVTAGSEYMRMGRSDDAIGEWRDAAALEPGSAEAWSRLADACRAAGRWNEAADAYRKLAGVRPGTPHVYALLAQCTIASAGSESALSAATRRLADDPRSVPDLAIAASALSGDAFGRDRPDYLRRLASLRPNDADFAASYATALMDAGSYTEAHQAAAHLEALRPGEPMAHLLCGWSLLESDSSRAAAVAAAAELGKAVRLDPTSTPAHLHLAEACLRADRTSDAIKELRAAAAISPKNWTVWYTLADAYAAAGDRADALLARRRFAKLDRLREQTLALKRELRTRPRDYGALLSLAVASMNIDDTDQARSSLLRALSLRPSDPSVRSLLAQLHSSAAVEH